MLKKWKEETERSLNSSRPILEELKASNAKRREKLNQLKAQTLSLHAQQQRTGQLTSQLDSTSSELKELVRDNITQLMRYIFPITCEGQPWYLRKALPCKRLTV